MEDLHNYFSQQDTISELKDKIKKLETTIRTLRQSNSKLKKAYRELREEEKPPTRTELVVEILKKVKAGEALLTHREIGKKFFCSIHYVRELSSKINKGEI